MKRFIVTALLLGAVFLVVKAQKLPNVQSGGLRAPATIKIDGKATEWGNQLQAYNHATEIYYTISNDDNNLYLTVQATRQAIINKILSGGVTFTISTTGKKKDKDGRSIIYPVFERKNKPFFGGGDKIKLDMDRGSAEATATTDSATAVHNRILGEKSKLIAVTGIAGIDTLISVYNADGIKVSEMFDNKGTYTYELAVSLKDLGLSVNNNPAFAYHITLTGENVFETLKISGAPKNEGERVINISGGDNTLLDTKIMLSGMTAAPTDFWGEYTLVKK